MIEISLPSGEKLQILNKTANAEEIWNALKKKGLMREFFYILHNGRLLYDENIIIEGRVTISPKILGGKGGFGSMLRAIGAQIEKTTNREACRDLSGRRLRDINEEKRLKAWIEKQALREKDSVERKKKKLERLCAEPKYEFKDKEYECERSSIGEKVDNSIEAGLKIVSSRSVPDSSIIEQKKVQRKGLKRKTILDDDDIGSDESCSSTDICDDMYSTKDKRVRQFIE